jgi:hypothetical protein
LLEFLDGRGFDEVFNVIHGCVLTIVILSKGESVI